jgi:N-acetylglutamate synthase-like GNAT family acetyltransferase
MNISTRSANAQDFPDIESLFREWGRAFGKSRNDHFFVAETEAGLVGVINLAFDDPAFVIRSLYVAQSARKQGVALKLLDCVDRELGVAEAYCLCMEGQQALGERIGLKQIAGLTAPDFLRARFERLRESDPEVILLKRSVGFEVRTLTVNDLQQAMELLAEFQLPEVRALTENDIRNIYSKIIASGGVVLGAFRRDQLLGTCTLNICANLSWSGRPYGIIENIIVTEGERNRGIGKSLLLVASRTAVNKNCYKVALMTQQRSEAMQAFYKSAGFSDDKVGYQMRFDAPLTL